MGLVLRNFILLLALTVAASSPAMAKEETKKGKPKNGLSLKKFSTKKTTKKPKVAKKKKSTRAVRSERAIPEGKIQYKDTIININKATPAALSAMLVGIGPVKATAIVDYREKNGKFRSLKDLMSVDGIGEATFDGLKNNVSTSRGKSVAPEGYVMEEVTSKPKKKRAKAKKRSTPSTSNTRASSSRRVLDLESDSPRAKKKKPARRLSVDTSESRGSSKSDKKAKKKKKVKKKVKSKKKPKGKKKKDQ